MNSYTNNDNRRWVSADDILKSYTDKEISDDLTTGIIGKYTQFIEAREKALREEMKKKAVKTAVNGQNSEEEELVC